MKWLEANGLTYRSVRFPAAFGKEGIPGVIATEDVPPFTEICDLPYRLLLSLDFVRAGELKSIFEKNSALFFHDKEADSICFAVHFLRMLIKGDSFWKSYIHRMLSQDTEMCYQWSDDLLEELQDHTLKLNIKGYGKEVESHWKSVTAVFAKHPDKFPKDKWNRSTYMKIYKYVSTHSFSGSMPCTMMLPFAECFNHENYCPIYLDFYQKSKGKGNLNEEKYDPNLNLQEELKGKQLWELPKDPDSEYEGSESEKDEDEDEDEEGSLTTKIHSNYKWWNPKSDDIHCYMRTGAKMIPANSHVYYSYGVRSNSDLLTTFGFLLMPNRLDNLKIVLWNNLNPWHNLKDSFTSLLVPEGLAARVAADYKEGLFDTEDPAYKEAELAAKVVKLCWSRVPSRTLMTYIRKQQMAQYKGKDGDKIMISTPLVVEFEIDCLEVAVQILLLKKNTWKSSVEEDVKVLEETKAGNKWRWQQCVYYRIGQKKLLEFHIEAYKLLIEILKNVSKPEHKYKEAYMMPVEKCEEEQEVVANRLVFKSYLQKLALNRKLLLKIPYQ
eukprot:TRINITY_DN12977_c0_g5_i1.p1 TRINITY_DN12977_c0_g5~~TRINITY_DN12977_c0_g5_i1.p1  ORF type:complete len:552 (-),score=139.05 TRINITY_DN12977_c0_g5_i1:137-1792(-)